MSKHEQITAAALHKRAIPHCDKCGSTDVRVEAFAHWNEKLQNWRIAELIETNQVCGHCGQECDIKWRLQ